MNFNFIDVLAILFLIAWILHGYRRGFLISLLDLLILIVSILLAAKAYPPISEFLSDSSELPRSYTNLMSFAAVFALLHTIFIVVATRYVYYRIIRRLAHIHLSRTDRFLGILPTAIGGLIWLSIVLGILTWFPVSSYLKDSIDSSLVAEPIIKTASVFEPQIEKIVGSAIEDTIGFATPREPGQDFRPNIPADAKLSYDAGAELYMLSLVNQERRLRGLRVLEFDSRIRDVARAHSLDMAKNNYFDHDSPTQESPFDRLLKARVYFLYAGENIAYAQNIDVAHESLMESEGHRENILYPSYGKIGIGIVNAGPFGYMITQDFTN